MTRIFLIRHAEAEGNLYRIAHGHFDGKITENGYRQIELLKNRFANEKIDAVYSSDLTRARVTAEGICQSHRLEFCTMDRLREVSIGEWEGLFWEAIEERWPEQLGYFVSDPVKWGIKGNESYSDLQNRITGCIKDIAKAHDDETVAIVCHGTAIRTFICGLMGYPSHEIAKVTRCDNTAVTMIVFENEELKLEYYGDNSHLNNEHS
ncbi:MAG: histidine phosphatase family protein [Oscillospiraceae bacterium]|nr:histidine phosphatase family protein [Oscillospiraceae bacterium]